jgi:two-component system, sensor histidine kinase LadS
MAIALRYLTAALFVTMIVCMPAYGQTSVNLSDTTAIYRLDNNVAIFIDSANTTTFETISAPEFQNRFRVNEKYLSFGFTQFPIWVRVNTSTSNPSAQWYLDLPAPFLEYVDFFQRGSAGQWQTLYSGYYVKQSVKKIPHTGHVFPLVFDAKNTSTVYLRITGQSPKTFQVLVMAKDRWYSKVRWEDVSYGVFFGILFVMFFYNLFIYFSLRQTNYLLYICTIVGTFFIFSSVAGYALRFIWPEHPEFNYYAGRLSLPILTIFLALFTMRFLEVRKYSKVMHYMLLAILPLSLAAFLLVITGTLSSAGNNLISISVVLFLTTGIICRIKGNKTASFYIAAWSIYMIGGLLLTLRNSGVFDFSFWTTHFVEIGACMETVIIALALGDQYRRLRREKEEAQLMALKIQTEATEKLEAKVRERTIELSRAYQDLHVTLERNQEQTRIIENKNAELDSFFYRISHDLKGPISSLLGLSNIARHEVKDEQANFYLEKQQQQIQRLNSIINGLIKLTRLTDAKLEKQNIDFDSLVDGCISSLAEIPNFNKITFTKQIAPDVELHSEWTLINAILQNLIENGIKYSRDKSPFVKVIVSREDRHVVIGVEDNGLGINEAHQSRIFDMFYRATHNSGGSGLGLYILKRSVDRLEGMVELQSQEGVGSTFRVKIPL